MLTNLSSTDSICLLKSHRLQQSFDGMLTFEEGGISVFPFTSLWNAALYFLLRLQN